MLLISLAPILSSFLTEAIEFKFPAFANASIIISPISSPFSVVSITATAVGPAPLIVHPNAPASKAVFFTASIPGINRTGTIGRCLETEHYCRFDTITT
ncbi:unnamed protein product [Arabis nemorensis]|uniref:Uncharacterized protein n=1 Tax=Arabis nemorensis TaxID=586526 RepID=A0A565C9C6_9BRAS|nr:unnamed protein product [Arabis nemorensis]